MIAWACGCRVRGRICAIFQQFFVVVLVVFFTKIFVLFEFFEFSVFFSRKMLLFHFLIFILFLGEEEVKNILLFFSFLSFFVLLFC